MLLCGNLYKNICDIDLYDLHNEFIYLSAGDLLIIISEEHLGYKLIYTIYSLTQNKLFCFRDYDMYGLRLFDMINSKMLVL